MGTLRRAIDNRLRYRLATAVMAVDQLTTRARVASRVPAVIVAVGLAVAIGVTFAVVW